jgi:hypothetical protein
MKEVVSVEVDPKVVRAVPELYSCEALLVGRSLTVRGNDAEEVRDVAERLAKITKEGAGMEHLREAKGLFYLIIAGVMTVSVAFIIAGLGLVYLGATGSTVITIFGQQIASQNVGVVSIGLGAVSLLVLIRRAMQHIQEILQIRRS